MPATNCDLFWLEFGWRFRPDFVEQANVLEGDDRLSREVLTKSICLS